MSSPQSVACAAGWFGIGALTDEPSLSALLSISPQQTPPLPTTQRVCPSDCVKYYKTKSYYLIFPTFTVPTLLARPNLRIALFNWPCALQPWVGEALLVLHSRTPEGGAVFRAQNLDIPSPSTPIQGKSLELTAAITIYDRDTEYASLTLDCKRQNRKRKSDEAEPVERRKTAAIAIPRAPPTVGDTELLPSAVSATYVTLLPLPVQAAYAVMMGMLEAVQSVLDLLGIDATTYFTSKNRVEGTYQSLGDRSLTLRHFNIGDCLIQSLAWSVGDAEQ